MATFVGPVGAAYEAAALKDELNGKQGVVCIRLLMTLFLEIETVRRDTALGDPIIGSSLKLVGLSLAFT